MQRIEYYRLNESTGLYIQKDQTAHLPMTISRSVTDFELPPGVGDKQVFLIDLEACAKITSEIDNNTGQKDFWDKGKIDIEMRVVIDGHSTLHELFNRNLGKVNSITVISKRLGIYRNANVVGTRFTSHDGRMVLNDSIIHTHLRMKIWLDCNAYIDGHKKEGAT